MSSIPSPLSSPTGVPHAAPTHSDSSPTGSPTSVQEASDTSANATLYLYTFLATLVLLLAISSAIVIRSLILRRRHQRLVEEAIRTGTWLPHSFGSGPRRRRDIGQKPKLWEAWLSPNDDDGDESEKKSGATSCLCMPHMSTRPRHHLRHSRPPRRIPHTLRCVLHGIRSLTRRRSLPSPQPTVLPMSGPALSSPSSLSSSPASTPTPAVHVAFLIAMPSPSQKRYCDESTPPVVEIGVVEANMKDDETETPSRDGL
ncbi:hypothetical protein HD554DRAFT_2112138 [Boletus coccyginus]|nr:hypothetical protein HD554DRAFT_2151184 [Boletus coccyginus]KAI9463007.1 hypothetical protein HD554DRAFT_2126116 [Boletus coccyginus]KAI9567047.1 hypothetical protein HD554DRAFT_2112138 [Boletus coccyginus]